MKPILFALLAISMAAGCTSTNVLTAPEQAGVAGIDKGDAITLNMTDGTTTRARFVGIEDGKIVYDDRAGERQRADLETVRSLDYRAYDSEKTGEVVAGTAAITGQVLLGLVQVMGALAGGMSY
ncbi:MAG: hypothetical protein QNJ19_11385 [Woeseiaceae bacterium]|nr:hypothetical protein [Woeseiaceae bacterium]